MRRTQSERQEPRAKELGGLQTLEKAEKQRFCLRRSGGTESADTLTVAQQDPLWTSDL